MFPVILLDCREEAISISFTLIAHNVVNSKQDLYRPLVLIFEYFGVLSWLYGPERCKLKVSYFQTFRL